MDASIEQPPVDYEKELADKLEFHRFLQETILNTIRFYSDNGDLVTAAFVTLTFYHQIKTYTIHKVDR
jgi:hypothetical protein